MSKKAYKKQSMFCVDQLFLSWNLLWHVVGIPSEITWKKTDFPFPRRYQLQMASWLAVGLCIHFPFLLEVCLGVNVCRFCRCYNSLCVSFLLCLEDVVSLVFSYLWLLWYLCLIFCIYPWMVRGEVWYIHPT